MSLRQILSSGLLRGSLLRGCLLRGGLAAAAVTSTLILSAGEGKSQVLYTLTTQCSLKGAPAKACIVEAVNEGESTLYRHKISGEVLTVRVRDQPVRMDLWSNDSKSWASLTRAEARFSTNTVCFNGTDLCVVNPNYLNSVLQNRAAVMKNRDHVMVHFGNDGRIDATCYDDGCDVVRK
ncbi:hypothetical protein [Synechococcus sp. RedBA-s]|uniref:hypothetical protein n=1 Tax=Synechococcus sp. RedBA-s TaxID=2823741 RepID=UPI0020CCC01B|nr:hypothetical protein [Synechococcus sp. RedBA-s]MCP9800007.1 hypothetical protein [Synechococcus sp. RedBA-s]